MLQKKQFKNKLLLSSLLLILLSQSIHAQYKYRILLKDKQQTGFTFEQPEKYLSQAALERRSKQQIELDSCDLPVSHYYIDKLLKQFGGSHISLKSKWLNSVVLYTPTKIDQALSLLPFVKTHKLVWQFKPLSTTKTKQLRSYFKATTNNKIKQLYHESFFQDSLINIIPLHQLGYKGEGINIAIIDGGFLNVNNISDFTQSKILGIRNFTDFNSDVYRASSHGTKCLSTMAADTPNRYIGTAPEANYYLFLSENSDFEMPIEEDTWAAAIEYADSIGVDLVSSSLGYRAHTENDLDFGYTTEMLDGETTFISKAAKIGCKKGLMIVCSAGNEGNKKWEKIIFPADVKEVITVGAIDKELRAASFTSKGFVKKDYIKPDLTALGVRTSVINSTGNIIHSNGTSYSCPTIAGAVACLMQALPNKSNQEIRDLIFSNATLSHQPNDLKGRGIPNFHASYLKANNTLEKTNSITTPSFFISQKRISINNLPKGENRIFIYTLTGALCFQTSTQASSWSKRVVELPEGYYSIVVENKTRRFSKKVILK